MLNAVSMAVNHAVLLNTTSSMLCADINLLLIGLYLSVVGVQSIILFTSNVGYITIITIVQHIILSHFVHVYATLSLSSIPT
jgi:hypothetical protein